jgi:hypothetical protein
MSPTLNAPDWGTDRSAEGTASRLVSMKVLVNALSGKGVPPLDTPLHGVTILLEIVLAVSSVTAWRKQVGERVFGKTFGGALAVSVVWTGLLLGYYFYAFGGATRIVVGHAP